MLPSVDFDYTNNLGSAKDSLTISINQTEPFSRIYQNPVWRWFFPWNLFWE